MRRWLENALLFPTLRAKRCTPSCDGIASGVLIERAAVSMQTAADRLRHRHRAGDHPDDGAISSRIGTDFLETLTSMFNPLPAIALLPLALIWFGLGTGSLIFVLVHSVLWAVALNTHAGFRGVSEHHAHGRAELWPAGLQLRAHDPDSRRIRSILTGLKMGWAFAWRTLIAAELVFGVSSG